MQATTAAWGCKSQEAVGVWERNPDRADSSIREQTAALMAGEESSEGFDDISEIEDEKSTAWRWFLEASGVTHERE